MCMCVRVNMCVYVHACVHACTYVCMYAMFVCNMVTFCIELPYSLVIRRMCVYFSEKLFVKFTLFVKRMRL